MLDAEARVAEGLTDEETPDLDLISQMAEMSLAKDKDEEKDPEEELQKSVLKMSNPVFSVSALMSFMNF